MTQRHGLTGVRISQLGVSFACRESRSCLWDRLLGRRARCGKEGPAADENGLMNLHYGCGTSVGTGWHNCDASPTLRLQRLPLLGVAFRRWLRDYHGNSHHLWMWDYKGLTKELQDAGFQGMRRCVCGDARDPAFQAVENPERFQWGLAIEATK